MDVELQTVCVFHTFLLSALFYAATLNSAAEAFNFCMLLIRDEEIPDEGVIILSITKTSSFTVAVETDVPLRGRQLCDIWACLLKKACFGVIKRGITAGGGGQVQLSVFPGRVHLLSVWNSPETQSKKRNELKQQEELSERLLPAELLVSASYS